MEKKNCKQKKKISRENKITFEKGMPEAVSSNSNYSYNYLRW